MTTATATLEGMIAAVIADPDADDLRLICADAYEEAGQAERAEFIRVQCELASLDRGVPGIQAVAAPLEDRERQSLQTMLDTSTPTRRIKTRADIVWAQAVLGRHVCVWPHEFRRGFVAEVTLSCADWQRHGPALVRAAPLREVRLTGKEPCFGATYPGRFVWRAWDHPRDAGNSIPTPIWELMSGDRMTPMGKWFDDVTSAHTALSAACLAWARSQPVRDT